MSKLKISEELFLEKQELNRFQKFIQIDGIRQNLLSGIQVFGILDGYNNILGLNISKERTFRVEVNTSNVDVDVLPGIAIDKLGNIIYSDYTRTINIPNNNLWYWIKIKYRAINEEIGKCSIDISGNVIGTNTKFTEIFRGEPSYPNKIKFTNSTLNVSEYEILEVIDDTNLKLVGNFTNENNLTFSCIGTFTSGFSPSSLNKFIYEYDDVEISLVQESSLNVQPNKTQDLEFYIARVKLNSSVIELQDKRIEFCKTKESFNFDSVSRIANPIIGVESVKWDLITTPRDKNEVNIVWGYRSTNWSINTAQNLITINSGIGGILKENDLSQYVNGFFNGWRLYVKSGKYYKVVSSIKQGSQLNIKLDVLIDTEFINGEEIKIVPDCEEIEIKTSYNGNNINTIIEDSFKFPINLATGKIFLKILSSTTNTLYNITYRYKTINSYSTYFSLPNDSIGLYAETSFNTNGTLKSNVIDRVRKPYTGSLTNGFIELVPNVRNLNIILDEIVTGDKFGVDYKTINNSSTVYDLVVGRDRIVQLLHFGTIIVGNDIFINLNKIRLDGTPTINGNKFLLQITGNINLNSRNIRIVTDYINPGSYTLIRQLSQADINFINANQWNISTGKSGLTYSINYDGTVWQLNNSNENYLAQLATLDTNILNEISARIAADNILTTNLNTLNNHVNTEIARIDTVDDAQNQLLNEKANRDVTVGTALNNLVGPNLTTGWRGALGLGYQIVRTGIMAINMGSGTTSASFSGGVSNIISVTFTPALSSAMQPWEFEIYMTFTNGNNNLTSASSSFGGGAHHIGFITNINGNSSAAGFDFRMVDLTPSGLVFGGINQMAGWVSYILVAKNREVIT